MSFLGLENDPNFVGPDSPEIKALMSKANTTFIISIVSMLFCCIGGIIATYFAYNAKQDAAAGNVAAAESNIKFAIGWMIATFIIGMLGIVVRLAQR